MRELLLALLAALALALPAVRGVRLLVMVGDRELAAASDVLEAWPAMNDTAVLYTRRGSYPDQQQIRLFDASPAASRTVAASPGTIVDIMQDLESGGRWVFIVSIKDDSTRAPSMAVVTPHSGLVYREILAAPGTQACGELAVHRYSREEIARVRGDLAQAQRSSADRIKVASLLARKAG